MRSQVRAQVPVRLSHVTLVYDGGVRALDNVSLEVARGERVCVLGANGSGKSTLASVICGLLAPDEGEVELVGERVCADGTPDLVAYRRARRSLGLVFQNPDDQIVTSVVEDDVAFGPENLGLPREEIATRVTRELHRVAMDDYAKADPSRLSGGQRQRVTIAGALAMEPQVLVLDEPGSLLDVRGRAAILRVMGRLAAAGTTLVHVTHFMEEALEASRVIVMDRGRVVLEGTPDEVFSHGDLLLGLGLEVPFAARLSRRLGLPWTCDEQTLVNELSEIRGAGPFASSAPPSETSEPAPPASPLLQVEHVSFAYDRGGRALDDVSFKVEAGTSTAIIGQTGSGKSTLLRLICGLEAPDEGRILVNGNDTFSRRGRRAARRAVGYVMQHPERQLFAETVEKDVAFGPRNLRLPAEEVERRVSRALEIVGLSDRRDASPFKLSGGQRRLCALAGILAMAPKILVLDEPTAGLDPRGRAMLRGVLAHLREQGITLVQVTHSMEDAARCDRVIALDQSRLVAMGGPREVFSRANERRLCENGLGIPRSLRVARELERRGWPALGDPLTTDELVASIESACAAQDSRAACPPLNQERGPVALRISVGQYVAARSPIHDLDARVKLVCVLVTLVAVFCVSNLAQLALAAAFVLAALLLSRVPADRVLASVRPLMVFLAVLSLFNLFFVRTGDVVATLGPLSVTSGGVLAAALYTARFALALVMGSLIMLTTTPTQLSDAFDRMLSPLSRLGLPGHQIAMVFSLMMRFIPTLADEATAIIDAQSLRGGAFDEGGPVQRVHSVAPVVVALLASGLRHADGLSRALDARCYEGGEGRTHFHEQRLEIRDAIAALATLAFVTALVALA